MADITDAQAVRFCNEQVRIAADQLIQVYNNATAILAEWTAKGGTNLVPNTADMVIDGAATDGRPLVTGININNVINCLTEFVADYEADNFAKLNTLLQVAVNTTRA